MIEMLVKVNPFIRSGLIASIIYILSCETKGTISKVLRYISLLFPLACLPFRFNIHSLYFCFAVTAGEFALNENWKSTGIAWFVMGYGGVCAAFVGMPFNVLYLLICLCVHTFILFQKDIRVMATAYSICVVVPLIICIMINHSLACTLLLMGDILLGVDYLKKNKWTMYTSQICFYVGACLAVEIL